MSFCKILMAAIIEDLNHKGLWNTVNLLSHVSSSTNMRLTWPEQPCYDMQGENISSSEEV